MGPMGPPRDLRGRRARQVRRVCPEDRVRQDPRVRLGVSWDMKWSSRTACFGRASRTTRSCPAFAACPDGKQPLGGGFEPVVLSTTNNVVFLTPVSSGPSATAAVPPAFGWSVSLRNNSGGIAQQRAIPRLGRLRLAAVTSLLVREWLAPSSGASHSSPFHTPSIGRLDQPGPRTARAIMSWSMKVTAETDKQRWEREMLEPALKKAPERAGPFTTISGRPIDRSTRPTMLADFDYARDLGDPGVFPYTRGIHPTGYRGKLWTMRQFAGFGTPEETNAALQDAARGGRHGPERRLRPADADGPRPRPRALARRSGEVRRQRHVARRHGTAVRRHRPRRHHDVDDDQLAGADDLRDVPGRGRAAGRRLDRRCRARSRTTSSRSSSRRRNTSSRRARRCGSSPTSSRSAPSKCRGGTRSRSAATTSARRARRRCRSWRSRCATASSTCSTASTPASTSTTSCRGCRSSSTRTATSSRRSPSIRAARKHLGAR